MFIIQLGPYVYSYTLPTDLTLMTATLENAVYDLPQLGLSTRLRIAVETYRGLAYLHGVESVGGTLTSTRPGPVLVHGDVKPQNILLDASLRALVADVGMAKVIQPSADQRSYASTVMKFGPMGGT